MGYARTETPLSDDALVAARWQVDLAGETVAVTAHARLP
jgi:hypothetical protein